MPNLLELRRTILLAALLTWPVLTQGARAAAETPGPDREPISYSVRFPSPAEHMAEVEATMPTGGRPSIELLMAAWTPGFYHRQDYAERIRGLEARRPDGLPLDVEAVADNRWRIRTEGASRVVVSYRVVCEEQTVSTNWVGDDHAVLNGAATFLTLAEDSKRPAEVVLEPAPGWPQTATALPAVDGRPHHYRAAGFDELVDSPILLGRLSVRELDGAGTPHRLVEVGDLDGWDAGPLAASLATMIGETRRFWGELPFDRYLFLVVHREGGGGLEHRDSTLVTAAPSRLQTDDGQERLLGLLTHEYMHAFIGKRLRPVELGPFDYENEVRTENLWVAEGLTSYFAELMLVRSGLISTDEYLASTSRRIARLQGSEGRLHQTLGQASLAVWETALSGLPEQQATTVSYYVKGPLVGLLLDVEIQRATAGRRSLDDAIRAAYQRYGGETGFTSEQLRELFDETAGTGLDDWLERAIRTTAELDYRPALEWYGLAFEEGGAEEGEDVEDVGPWRLTVSADSSPRQDARRIRWLTGTLPPPVRP
jgi:predicted metalloprotease with PDZ domain